MNINSNDLEDILAHALATIKEKMGESYSIEKVNLAELHRITGISRAKLRRLKKNGFAVKPNGNKGKKFDKTVLSGYEGVINNLLGYISKMVNSRNRINEKIIFLHVSNTEEICDLMHSFLD